jgi:hypothetical protein
LSKNFLPPTYILRNPETGQLYKVGKTDNVLGSRFGEYEKWESYGVPLVADIYPLKGMSGITLEWAEAQLRQVVKGDGWALPSDIKKTIPRSTVISVSSIDP